MSVKHNLFFLSPLALLLLAFLPGDVPYRFPLSTRTALSGTFGELRNDHFHAGLDIKTGGVTGVPIYSVADGYVYRIRVGPYGFGRALYVRHPDRNYAIYGHLDGFNEVIDAYLRENQYDTRQYSQDLYLPPGQIPVKTGDLIAYSGNSGSSQGPHLHFEIRDSDDRVLNPMEWYRDRISDTRKPLVQEIAIEPIDADARINGAFAKYYTTPTGSSGFYTLPSVPVVRGRVGIEFRGYDLLDSAENACGITRARLYVDEQLAWEYDLRVLSFDDTRYINLHTDFAVWKRERKRMQKAYMDFGNELPAYRSNAARGMIEIHDELEHTFRLELEDLHGNRSYVNGKLKGSTAPDKELPAFPVSGAAPKVSWELRRNTLIVYAEKPLASWRGGLPYRNVLGEEKLLMPSTFQGGKLAYILPLDPYNYPEVVRDPAGRVLFDFYFRSEIMPDRNNLAEDGELQVFFPYSSVFDRVSLQIRRIPGDAGMYSDRFVIGDTHIPLRKPYLVSFKSLKKGNLSHMVVAKREGGGWKYAGNVLGEDENVYVSMQEFGEFCLMADSLPPSVRPLNFSTSRVPAGQQNISLRVDDSFSGIDHLS
ncbi:MAG: M23 family metallopeptidase, partial [Bacteroidetes bacterium]